MFQECVQQSFQQTLKGFLIAASIAGFAGVAMADGSHDEKKAFTSTELKPGFVMLQGKGGNVLLSHGEDGLLLIDADYTEMASALEAALKGYEGELQYLLNTHWHGDHTGGNHVFGKDAKIIAHENVRERLSSRQEIKLFNMVSEPYPDHALPGVTFDNGITLHFNAETINALHLPKGHTDGDSVVLFENANIVHMGDHYFAGMFPFVDVASGGSVRGVAENITGVLDRIDDKTIVVPGHGPLSNKQELIAFRDMLKGTADEVDAMMQEGLSLEAMQKKGLSDQWKAWGNGFINEATWIGIVHDSLSKAA